jgi:hypothetical protein
MSGIKFIRCAQSQNILRVTTSQHMYNSIVYDISLTFKNTNVDIKLSVQGLVFRITLIGYAHDIGKPNNYKCLGAIKPKGLNRIATIGYLWSRMPEGGEPKF